MSVKSPLSPLEQKVMEVVWSSRGRVTAAAVQAALTPHHELKDSTVRTILTRLEEKQYLQHEVDGRTFVYRSMEPPRNLAVRAVRQLVDRFCHGSVESLLVGMVDDEIVDTQELQRIADQLARRHAAKNRSPAKRKDPKK